MSNLIIKIFTVVACLLGLAVFAILLFLSSSLLATQRGNFTARMISERLGHPVQINGGVRIDLGSVLQVSVQDLVIPSQLLTDVNLVEIGTVQFDLALNDLLQGRIDLLNLHAQQTHISLVVDKNGVTSWSPAKPASGGENSLDISGLIAGNTIHLPDTTLLYQDARNGLDLNLHLATLALSQQNHAAPLTVDADGALNGQHLTLNGTFPRADPFEISAKFDHLAVQIDGTPDPQGYTAGFSAALSADIAELGQLLDVLKLQKTVAGNGQISAVFKSTPESKRLENLKVNLALDSGPRLDLTGDLGELGNPDDVSIDTKIHLFAPDNIPAPTRARRDLKLTRVDMQLMANPGGIPQRRMVIATNGFVLDTQGEGPPPVAVSDIARTPDGRLTLGKVELRIGPPNSPILVLDGSVADALQLDGIDFGATLDLPTASLLGPELFQLSDTLGRVTGGFHLSGNAQTLHLTDLQAISHGTELWSLNVSGSVENALKFENVILDVAADVPSGSKLLSALQLPPVEIGPVQLSANVSSQGLIWDAGAKIAVEKSHLDLSVHLDLESEQPKLSGLIESDIIRVKDLRQIIASRAQLEKLDRQDPETTTTEPLPEHGNIVQPLVLNTPEPPGSETSTPPLDSASAPDSAVRQDGPFRDVTLQPLGRALLLSGMILDVQIDLRKIEGARGTTSLQSELVMKDQIAQLGPIEFAFGGGHFNITGLIDLGNSPESLQLSGSTGGWNFGDILHELKFKKGASGVLNASFDVSGKHNTVKNFLATMSGRGLVSMRNGSIDNQLLDLAGLGILPWLFSKNRGDAAPIVCLHAPLNVANGRISTKNAVVETDLVQVVVNGQVDTRNKTLQITGQPRQIGKPLSRSPWPFTAAGPIANPDIKVKDGPRRVRRSDGASTMPEKRRTCVPDILQLH